MSAAGGSNIASARRAVSDLDAVYLLLVAYGDFGGCNRELAATGRPGPHGEKAAALILSACRPLERAAAPVRAGDAAERPPGAPRRDAGLGGGSADSRARRLLHSMRSGRQPAILKTWQRALSVAHAAVRRRASPSRDQPRSASSSRRSCGRSCSATSPRSSGSGSRTTTSTSRSRQLLGGALEPARRAHGPPRRIPRARPGAAARPASVARPHDRLRPPDRLAPLERLPRDRPRRRAHGARGARVRDGREPARSSTSSGACSRTASRSGWSPRRSGSGSSLLVTVTSIAIVRRRMRYELWYWVHLTAYAGIAFAWFHEIPTGGDINAAFHPTPTTYWRVLFFGTFGLVILFRVRRPGRRRLLLPAPRRRGDRRGADVTSIRMTGHHVEPPACRGPGSSSSGASSPAGTGGRRTPSRSRRRPTAARSGSAPRRPETTRRACGRSRSARASSPRGRTARSPSRSRRRDKALLIAGGIGITPGARARRDDGGRRRRHLPRPREEDIVFGDELAVLAERRDLDRPLRRRRPPVGRGTRPALDRAPPRARPGRRRAGRLPLRAARHGRRDRRKRPSCGSPPAVPSRRTLRVVTIVGNPNLLDERRSTGYSLAQG